MAWVYDANFFNGRQEVYLSHHVTITIRFYSNSYIYLRMQQFSMTLLYMNSQNLGFCKDINGFHRCINDLFSI